MSKLRRKTIPNFIKKNFPEYIKIEDGLFIKMLNNYNISIAYGISEYKCLFIHLVKSNNVKLEKLSDEIKSYRIKDEDIFNKLKKIDEELMVEYKKLSIENL
jgi:hypothetical protein